jgi:hypothetical protein
MKSILRFICLVLMVSGWVVAALCLHVIRTPDPQNPKQSKLVVIPKQRLGIQDTYVDARNWTMVDVPDHGPLVLEMIGAQKADELKFLADPTSKQSVEIQLVDVLTTAQKSSPSAATTRIPHVH